MQQSSCMTIVVAYLTLLQRLQSLIQFVRTRCLNDVQAKIVSAICGNFDFVDARHSCEDGTYVVVIHFIHHFGCSDVRCTSQKEASTKRKVYYAPG